MGAPAITKLEPPISVGRIYKEVIAFCNGPASYTTGGDVILAKDLGLTTVIFVEIIAMLGTRMALPVFAANDSPEPSFKMLIASIAGVEVANASDQSALKFRIKARGLY